MIPGHPLDDPRLPVETFILWTWNGRAWPDGARRVSYLTNKWFDTMKGYALFTPSWEDAATFSTVQEANAFLAEQNAKRPIAYSGLNLTTVEDLRKQVQFPESRK